MMLFKNPLFLIGFIFVAGLLLTSFIYTAAVDNEVYQIYHIYDENKELIDSAPIAPRKESWLGTDKLGYDMLSKGINWGKVYGYSGSSYCLVTNGFIDSTRIDAWSLFFKRAKIYK
ncbi:hypothetical protein [Bacillus sp. AFS040349]|uniref:hypothetical protein n=1 Tax=Bacillus sp. AFS040349 TaxID=2033502 RepID=UPI000BFBDDA1|nr:hypothetical protein [Bacillus sp. AFS040349]PGT90540.1 hypothetical protein COD11_02435 [Bacillus sp. AFS040349]